MSLGFSIARIGLLGLAVSFGVGAGGCAIERTPGDVQDDAPTPPAPPPEVPPFGSPVEIVDTFPRHGDMDVPVDTPVWIEFDRYLDPEFLALRSTIRMQTGGRFATVAVQWQMVDKRLVGTLSGPLISDVQYTFSVDEDRIVGMDGSPMFDAPTFAFKTAPIVLDQTVERRAPSFAADIAPVLERACSCHRMDVFPDPWFDIAALTYERMVGQLGRTDPDYYLVDPYRPAFSTLLRKALPDFPIRHGSAMPPVWGPDQKRTRDLPQRPLDADELRLVEEWILIGAPP